MSNEYIKNPPLSDWLKDFADQYSKVAAHSKDINSIFNNQLNAVEAKVKELRDRVGLDKIGEEENKIEKQACIDPEILKKTVTVLEEQLELLKQLLSSGFASNELIDKFQKTKNEYDQFKEMIPGGLAAGKKPEDFDPKQIEKGIRVELEHSGNKELAAEIATDHLAENPKYYDYLEEMEKKMDAAEANLYVSLSKIASKSINAAKLINIIKDKLNCNFSLSKRAKTFIEIFKEHPEIKKYIDNVCISRRGFINPPAVLEMVQNRLRDLPEEEMAKIKKYIEKKIETERSQVTLPNDSDILGKHPTVETDFETPEVFAKPTRT